MLAKAKAYAKAKVKHIYSTGVIYDRQNILIFQATGLCTQDFQPGI